ncbi:hypothetical protein A9P82_02420 [Arachidicoccus ginsenosidimutans]|uniref:hypothetical protein n=1 Tax=Arachidicoccus sp. BS20 TaxID=1850526 RepID=UPI0007F07D24|nr:hypothetical protein [Arachidicoccus sp. BS20]ANI88256.1 hypothetical protein A9P82_02420 [Arachidicoccus sp. BS20]
MKRITLSLLSVVLITLITIFIYSCTRKELHVIRVGNYTFKDSSELLFFKWAQANNGRWMPYSIRLSLKDSGNASSQTLNSLASIIKSVNGAKAYYKGLLQQRIGLSDSLMDVYLDSLYLRKYKTVNASLKYRKTMDSLYAIYGQINSGKSTGNTTQTAVTATGVLSVKKYIPGNYTAMFDKTVAPKIIASIQSGNPDGNYLAEGCVPVELTDWFDEHYNGVYTKLIAAAKEGNIDMLDYFATIVNRSGMSIYEQDFINRFWEYSLGFYLEGTTAPNITSHPLNCGQMTDSIVVDIADYYAAIKTAIPDELGNILSDGDPFESDMDIYFTDYQLTASDMALWNQIDREDEAADMIMQNYTCKGGPNMWGNIFLTGIGQGIIAHSIIELHYLTLHPNAEREYWIPESSSNNPNNYGRADIANPYTGEIFEIKPGENQTEMTKGINEANTYVTKANQYCLSSLHGVSTWALGTTFTTVTLPYSPTQDVVAELYKPGLIGYKLVSKNTNTLPITVPQSVAERFKKLVERLSHLENIISPNNYERIISEFLRDPNNQDMVNYIKTAAVGVGVGIVVGTLIEDFLSDGMGFYDDIACFKVAYKIVRAAWKL